MFGYIAQDDMRGKGRNSYPTHSAVGIENDKKRESKQMRKVGKKGAQNHVGKYHIYIPAPIFEHVTSKNSGSVKGPTIPRQPPIHSQMGKRKAQELGDGVSPDETRRSTRRKSNINYSEDVKDENEKKPLKKTASKLKKEPIPETNSEGNDGAEEVCDL